MDWLTIASNFGIPTTILAAVFWGGFKISNRVIDEIMKPALIRVMAWFDAKELTDEKNAETLKQIAEVQMKHLQICTAAGAHQQVSEETRHKITGVMVE